MKNRIRGNEVHVGELSIGTVVELSTIGYTPNGDEDFGHIVGFERNEHDELLLVVQFSRPSISTTDNVRTVYPCNVFVYI